METVKGQWAFVQLLLVPWAFLDGCYSAIQRPLALVCMDFAQQAYEWRTKLRVSQRERASRAESEGQYPLIARAGLLAIDEVIKKW